MNFSHLFHRTTLLLLLKELTQKNALPSLILSFLKFQAKLGSGPMDLNTEIYHDVLQDVGSCYALAPQLNYTPHCSGPRIQPTICGPCMTAFFISLKLSFDIYLVHAHTRSRRITLPLNLRPRPTSAPS